MGSLRSSPLRAYRIADRRHKIFDGTGAAIHGGRWNSPGRRVIYAAETYAGAMLEALAHSNVGRLPKTQVWIEILIGKSLRVEVLDPAELPGWHASNQLVSRAYGDRWYDQKRTAVLLVPSIVVTLERNVAINQDHPDFSKFRATLPRPVVWDHRLFGRN